MVKVTGLACTRPDLVDRCVDLTNRRDVSLTSLGAQRLADLIERALDRVEPRGDVAPRVLGISRHEVEDGSDLLCLAANDAYPRGRGVGVVELNVHAKPLEHRLLRCVLAFIAWCGGMESGDRTADVRNAVS